MDISAALFDGWAGIINILISAPLVYAAIILFIRLAGKRSTSQMNNFDWIVTVAMGSITGSGILLDNVTASEALFAIALLLLMQYVVTYGISRIPGLGMLMKAEPRLLVSNGQYLDQALRQERLNRDEVMAAIRESGFTSLDQVKWVILETDASFSVIPLKEEHQTMPPGQDILASSAS